ncbi:MAG: phosphocholine cytidylyltransferase family protein [Treponema sp.]|nr:phosphocholine cytidylyltransferase family protein [Treponema sp.]
MNVLILAAGRGTRISRYLGGNPKCTVKIGNTTLIQYTINLLKSKGINKIGIVLGYQDKVIRDILKNEQVEFFYNPFFDVTNSIASCWFARNFMNQDEELMIMNGDVFIEESILDMILSEEKSPVLFADETRKEEADYKFKYENNVLQKYGKELTGDDITGEYIGIAKLKRDYIPVFTAQLEKMINTQNHSVWWENVLYELSAKKTIYVKDVEGRFWAEVDYIEDYERIKKYVNENLHI